MVSRSFITIFENKCNWNLFFSFILAFIATAIFTYLNRHFELDDALIYYRYIQNVIDGHGLVYNIGERFNGLTSPLYTYLSIVIACIFRNVPISQLILSGFFLFLSSIAFALAFRSVISEKVLAFLPPLLVTNYYYYITFGMESTMLLFLILMAIYFYRENKVGALATTSALLLLTRGESLFLVMILVIAHFIQQRPFPNWKVFILPLLLLGSHYLFNYLYYGELMPATMAAKIGQGSSGLWGEPPIFLHQKKDFLRNYFGMNYFLISFLAILAIFGIIRFIKDHIFLICLGYFVLYNLFYILLNIPNYPWYFIYDFLFLGISVSLGFDSIYRSFSGQKKAVFQRLAYPVALLAFLSILIPQTAWAYTRLKVASGLGHYQQIGLWLKNNTPLDAKVAAIEIGTIGWYSDRYIIDILGLVNPYNADFIAKRQFDKWLEKYHPDYIVVHDPIWSHEVSVKKLFDANKIILAIRIGGFSIYTVPH